MIDHLSYSSISAYNECGMFWKFRYVDKIATPANGNLAFGSAWHNTIEAYLTGQEKDLMKAWDENWQKQLEANVEWGADDPATLYNMGVRWINEKITGDSNSDTMTKFLDSIEPGRMGDTYLVEKKVSLQVPGVDVPVIGYIDIITRDGVPGDFKTAGRSWTTDQAVGALQPLFYLGALNQEGIGVPDGRFRHYVFVKNKQLKIQIIETAHRIEELFFLFGVIAHTWKAIQAGVFVENPGSWKCKPGVCEFYNLCRGKYG